MTIKECRTRKTRFKKILDKLQWHEFSRLSDKDFDLLELAVMRSMAMEDLNIAELKKREKLEKQLANTVAISKMETTTND